MRNKIESVLVLKEKSRRKIRPTKLSQTSKMCKENVERISLEQEIFVKFTLCRFLIYKYAQDFQTLTKADSREVYQLNKTTTSLNSRSSKNKMKPNVSSYFATTFYTLKILKSSFAKRPERRVLTRTYKSNLI